MTLSATEAITLTANAISVQDSQDLRAEVTRAESAIRNATTRQLYAVLYDASIVGNPDVDPSNDDGLTAQQIAFRDAFEATGFVLGRDEDSGLWSISWDSQGAEHLVSVYSIRTTLAPGAVQTATITNIETYFETLTPKVLARVSIVPYNGGDIDETEFGAVASVSYEYIAVVTQPNSTLDYSTGLKSALVASGLGYDDSGSDNVEVYKVA